MLDRRQYSPNESLRSSATTMLFPSAQAEESVPLTATDALFGPGTQACSQTAPRSQSQPQRLPHPQAQAQAQRPPCPQPQAQAPLARAEVRRAEGQGDVIIWYRAKRVWLASALLVAAVDAIIPAPIAGDRAAKRQPAAAQAADEQSAMAERDRPGPD